MAVTKIADVIVPSVFTEYSQQLTMQLAAFIQSGIVVLDPQLNALLAGPGLTFNLPSWNPLADTDEDLQSDDDTVNSVPEKVGATQEVGVRLSRHKSWSAMDIVATLAGSDPMESVARQTATYWAQRLQKTAIATVQGVFADNAAAPTGTEHVQNDLTNDISDDSAGAYEEGVTDFSAEAVIDTATLMGDAMAALTGIVMHSIVYAKALKNDLIDFEPDSNGRLTLPSFMGKRVVLDDGVPNPAGAGAAATAAGVYHTWLFGTGALRMGRGSPPVPTEMERKPSAGNGAGQDILHNRVEWMIHPTGHKYAGTPPNSGPSNASTSNNLAHAASWQRVFAERKMIKMARLITKES
jgi:hypothetical protein